MVSMAFDAELILSSCVLEDCSQKMPSQLKHDSLLNGNSRFLRMTLTWATHRSDLV